MSLRNSRFRGSPRSGEIWDDSELMTEITCPPGPITRPPPPERGIQADDHWRPPSYRLLVLCSRDPEYHRQRCASNIQRPTSSTGDTPPNTAAGSERRSAGDLRNGVESRGLGIDAERRLGRGLKIVKLKRVSFSFSLLEERGGAENYGISR